MKKNYADRSSDKNIIEKDFVIKDIDYKNFKGKAALIKIKKVKKEFKVNRPDGKEEKVIANGFNIMTFFPLNDRYCINIMYDNNFKLLQWYFDINKNVCEYDGNNIPYSEDMYLDVVALPNGKFYNLDEDDLDVALKQNVITKKDFDMAYVTRNKITKMLKEEFKEFCDFTKYCLENLK